MSSTLDSSPCSQSAQVSAYVIQALPPGEAAALEAHIASCSQCQQELEELRPVAASFAFWPTDVLRPPVALQERLARRIATERKPGAAVGRAVGRAGMGRSCPRNLLQADGDRYREASSEHAGATPAWRGISRAHPCRAGGAVPARRRAVDRRSEALPGRLQPGRGSLQRQACVERNRLHLRSHHQHPGHSRILSLVGCVAGFVGVDASLRQRVR